MTRVVLKFRGAVRYGRAFTLVEVMVCLAIAAALTGLAVANLRAARRADGLRAALVELQSQDHLMRDQARRWGHRGELVFDMETGTAARVGPDPDGQERNEPLAAFTDGVRVEAVRTATGRSDGSSAVRIGCSGAGRTASYAVLVSAGENRQWVVVLGLTGKFEKVDDEAQVEDIFAQLRAGDRDDAR